MNYYYESNVCPCCNRPEQRVKIAHQVEGWCLVVSINLDKLPFQPHDRVVDSNGDVINLNNLIKCAKAEKGTGLGDRVFMYDRYVTRETWLAFHQAVLAPSGLVRRANAFHRDNIDYEESAL